MPHRLTQVVSCEQSPSEESRDARIRFGNEGIRVEPQTKDAFMRFKAANQYSKTTDAINRLLRDGLSVNGYMPQVTAPFVTTRHTEMTTFTATDEEVLARYCAIHKLTWHEAISELLSKALYEVKQCEYVRSEWKPEAAEEEKRRA